MVILSNFLAFEKSVSIYDQPTNTSKDVHDPHEFNLAETNEILAYEVSNKITLDIALNTLHQLFNRTH
ncbi:hypothetical protein [Paenibacillus pini]|uniref:Uncharacterized protein n=2 Tax=Paenibacillus TaxID=44249 RepID=W7YNG7_9BACL|nr:hypothetical protein JCM16418_123 [Paenibacillus pini JCM 16418]